MKNAIFAALAAGLIGSSAALAAPAHTAISPDELVEQPADGLIMAGYRHDSAFPPLFPAAKPTAVSLNLVAFAPGDSGWRETEEGFFHLPSGMNCPVTFPMPTGGTEDAPVPMLLTGIKVYDQAGMDTSCDYLTEDQSYLLTKYASYWPQITLQQHFDGAVRSMRERFPVSGETNIVVPELETGAGSQVKTATLAEAYDTEPLGDGRGYQTGLWLNQAGDWHIKVRATYAPPSLFSQIFAMLTHTQLLLAVDQHLLSRQMVDANDDLIQAVSFTPVTPAGDK